MIEHDTHRERMQQIAEHDAAYEQQRINDNGLMRGLIVGIVIMLCMCFGIYKIIQWYVSTMPPRSFIGLHKDAR